MTMLTGRPNNYVRILESQYQADITAAEERGRATAAVSKPASSASPVAEGVAPTQEETAAMAEVRLLQKAAADAAEQDPMAEAAKLQAYVNEQKKQGRNVSLAQASAEINKK